MIKIIAFIRKKKFKKKNYINCILYGKNFKNINLRLINNLNFYKNLKINSDLNLIILNKNYKVKIKEINLNPYKNLIIHIDFLILNEEF